MSMQCVWVCVGARARKPAVSNNENALCFGVGTRMRARKRESGQCAFVISGVKMHMCTPFGDRI